MGTVFLARHKNNGNTAAIKILHPELARDDDTRSRFMQEGYAANRVNHPGVVRILDDDVTEDGFAYLVMELLEGELLERRRLRMGGKLELAEVYEIADALLDVLAAAHANGIVHRDVKPDNLFIARDGRLKVLDFGFAQMKSSYRTENTATGFLIGTPGFMAPEQAMGQSNQVDARTDIWAVGATMFLVLTGQPCHAGDSPGAMLALAANFAAPSITTLEPGLPPRLSAAIDRALAFKKSDRWPDARAMQTALREIAGRVSTKDASRRSHADGGIDKGAIGVMKVHDDVSSVEDETVARETSLEPDTLSRSDANRPSSASAAFSERETPLLHSAARDDSSSLETIVRLRSDPPPDGTVVMASRPIRESSPDFGRPPTAHYPSVSSPGGYPPTQGLLSGSPPSSASVAPFPPLATTKPPVVQPSNTPSSPAKTGRNGDRILSFLLVVVFTMVVVILTGLLVILGTE